MVMGGKKRFRSSSLIRFVKELNNGPGDTDSIKGAGSPAILIQNDQAVWRGVIKDVGGFVHFNHESGLTL